MRIAVVGAGLGGVAAAVGLHRTGHEVIVYERGAELREAGTAVVIAPNGVRALEALGAQDAVRGRGLRGVTGGLRDRRGRPLLVTDLAPAQQQVGMMAVVHRRELHRALRAPLPDGLARTATPVERLESDAEGVTVISGGEAVGRADAVIAADGIGSTLRARMFPGNPRLRRVGRLDLRGILPTPAGLDATGILAGMLIDRRSGAMFGLFPLGDEHLYWFTDSALSTTPTDPAEARLAMLSLTADWHPAVAAVIEATPPADIYADALARLAAPLPSFATGRIALLGDAAHAMTPDLGQGTSQAFEDAASLARHMAGADPAEAAQRLRRYDAERRPRANRMILASTRQARMTALTGAAALLRDGLLRAVPRRLAARQLAALWRS